MNESHRKQHPDKQDEISGGRKYKKSVYPSGSQDMFASLKHISLRSFKVWRRDFKVFLKTYKVSLLLPFLEPLFYLLSLGFGLGAYIEDVGGSSYAVFIAPAIIAISGMNASFFESTYSSFVRMQFQKTFDAIIATPLTIEDVIAGEILWGATKALINASLVLVVISFFRLVHSPACLLIIPLSFLAGIAFSSLGMIFTSIVKEINNFNYPVFLLITPMFLISGTFFPTEGLPKAVQYISLLLPLTHYTAAARAFNTGSFSILIILNLLYLMIFSAWCFPISIFLMKKRLIK